MANVLSQSPSLVCTHEPLPRLVEETAQWRYGELSTADYGEMLVQSRPPTVGGRRYGESANRLSLGVPVLAEVFESSQFVWLVRDGRDVVSSGHQRGWYDHAADTVWERCRLRGDRLGEIDDSEWSAWSPFRRVCWLWSRTNQMIRDDLATLAPERHTTVRLEGLDSELDSIAGFLGAVATDWVVPRLNARGQGQVDESGANRVDSRFGRANWSDGEHEVFDEVCGPLMDELYPEWRESDGESDSATPGAAASPPEATSDAGVEAAFADVRSLRAELSMLIDHVQRVDRRSRKLGDELGTERVKLDKSVRKVQDRDERIQDLESKQHTLTATLEEIASSRDSSVADLERELAEVRGSASFRFGHSVVIAVRGPMRLLSSVRRRLARLRSGPRAVVMASARRAAAVPGATKLAARLPEPVRQKLQAAATSAAPTTRSTKGLRKKSWGVAGSGLGLRTVLAGGVSSADWGGGLDVVALDDAAELANLDLFLTGPTVAPAMEEEATRRPDAAVIAVHDRLPPIPASLTPRGFSREHTGTFLSLDSCAVSQPSPGRIVVQRSLDDLPDPLTDGDDFRLAAQTHLAVVDSGAEASLTRAIALTRLCAVGLPVSVSDPEQYAELIPEAILAEWSETIPASLTVELARERASQRQRGLVHDHLGRRARFDSLLQDHGRPGLPSMSVSVTVATNRPDMVDHWSRQLEVQDHPDFEVVAALHGDAFDEGTVARLRDRLGDRLTVLRIDESHTLGDALNAAARAAAGDLLVKWDDDDFYDLCHLQDLVRAKEYSGATLVGKAAEFAYLAGPDRTVRRLKTSSEAFSRTICGATLAITRADLRELGGWRRSRRRVDSMLIEDVAAAGGATYRTSGFGFVMMRAGAVGHSHTWTADDDYFLDGAIDQRRGLALDFCGVRTPDEVVAPWL